MQLELEGKVALVTGSSQGIGRAIAEELVREGVKVAMCAREARVLEASAEALRKKYGADVLTRVMDVAQEGAIETLIEQLVERWGRLDILVNNAGGPPPGDFQSLGDADWQSAYSLSVMSVVRAVRASLPHLKASGAGRVINILSTSVKEVLPGMLLSNSLRTAVAGLAKTLSRELGESGITVNNVCPGHIFTRRLREVAAARKAAGHQVDPRAAVEAIPLRRLGAPADVAGLVAFLASSRGSYITGATIPVDGGSTSSLT